MKVDAVLAEVLDRHGVADQVRRMGVLDAWPGIVGEQVAKVARAKGVQDATLYVEVDTSAWLMELNMLRAEFLKRVNACFVETPLERIVFVLAETK